MNVRKDSGALMNRQMRAVAALDGSIAAGPPGGAVGRDTSANSAQSPDGRPHRRDRTRGGAEPPGGRPCGGPPGARAAREWAVGGGQDGAGAHAGGHPPRRHVVARSLQDVMSLRTYAGGMRVAVMARADRLTEPAADALLKTLEEPPPGTVIVLCTASPEALPATILSRTQQVALAPVAVPRVTAWLAAAGVA